MNPAPASASGIDISRLLFTAYVLSLGRRRIVDTNLGVSARVSLVFRAASRLALALVVLSTSVAPLSCEFGMHEARVSQ